jgi:hypothetical protein
VVVVGGVAGRRHRWWWSGCRQEVQEVAMAVCAGHRGAHGNGHGCMAAEVGCLVTEVMYGCGLAVYATPRVHLPGGPVSWPDFVIASDLPAAVS